MAPVLRTRSSKLNVLRRIKRGANNTTIDPLSFTRRGITYKGKLIGEHYVCEARGAEMCAEAMQKAKSAVKAANVSKARILLQITQDGIKILDEKSHAVLHYFSVSQISFIARDETDARAFGLIYGENPQSYKFYAIKTAQAADQAVLAIREMFQMVFKKNAKQMKPAIQHQEDIQMATNPFVATSTMALDPFKACSAVDWAFKENADTHTAASTRYGVFLTIVDIPVFD